MYITLLHIEIYIYKIIIDYSCYLYPDYVRSGCYLHVPSWLKQPVFLNHQKHSKQNRQLINLVPEYHPCRKGTSSSKPLLLGSIFFFAKCMRLRGLNSSYFTSTDNTRLGGRSPGGLRGLGAWLVLLSSPCHLCHPYHLCVAILARSLFCAAKTWRIFFFSKMMRVFFWERGWQ